MTQFKKNLTVIAIVLLFVLTFGALCAVAGGFAIGAFAAIHLVIAGKWLMAAEAVLVSILSVVFAYFWEKFVVSGAISTLIDKLASSRHPSRS